MYRKAIWWPATNPAAMQVGRTHLLPSSHTACIQTRVADGPVSFTHFVPVSLLAVIPSPCYCMNIVSLLHICLLAYSFYFHRQNFLLVFSLHSVFKCGIKAALRVAKTWILFSSSRAWCIVMQYACNVVQHDECYWRDAVCYIFSGLWWILPSLVVEIHIDSYVRTAYHCMRWCYSARAAPPGKSEQIPAAVNCYWWPMHLLIACLYVKLSLESSQTVST